MHLPVNGQVGRPALRRASAWHKAPHLVKYKPLAWAFTTPFANVAPARRMRLQPVPQQSKRQSGKHVPQRVPPQRKPKKAHSARNPSGRVKHKTRQLAPVPAYVQLTAPQAGVLLETSVRKGDSVRADQPLVVLGTAPLATESIAQRCNALLTERSQCEQHAEQRRQALSARIRDTEAALRRTRGEAAQARHRVQLATNALGRHHRLAKEGLVDEVQAQQKQRELLDLQARAQAAERNAAALQHNRQALQAELDSVHSQLRTELAQLDRTVAALTQESIENGGRSTLVITAPQAGVVTARMAGVGQPVQAGQSLLTLAPRAMPEQHHACRRAVAHREPCSLTIIGAVT